MANRADGSIVIDTKLDSSGFSKGSKEMQGAISSLQQQVDALGRRMDSTFSAMQRSINDITRNTKAQSQAQRQAQEEAQAQAQASGQVQEQAQSRSATFAEMIKNAFRTAVDAVASFGENTSGAAGAVIRFGRLAGSAIGTTVGTLGRLGLTAVKVQGQLLMLTGSALANSLKGIAGRAAEVAERILGIGSAASHTKSPLQNGLLSLLKYGLGISGIVGIINLARNAIKTGLGDLAQFSAPLNSAVESVRQSLAVLKGSLTAAFAPIYTAIAPAIVYLCNLLSTALNYIASFMSAITGGKTYIKATKGAQGLAKSVGAAGKAAKESGRQLAEFDKLNILADKGSDGGGGGGGGGGAGSGVGFEEVPIESAIADFVQRIKDAFAAGDFEEVGRIIAEGINKAVQKLKEFISWDRVHEFWEYWIDAFCRIFNSLVKNIDWYEIGATIAEGFNTLLHILELFLTGIDWKQLGVALGTALNGLVDNFDFKLFGRVLGERFQAGLDFLYGAVTTFDWAKLGHGIADSINSYISVINWEEVGQTLSAGLRGMLQTLAQILMDTDWSAIGEAVADILGSIDWGGLIHDFMLGLGALNGAIDAVIGGFISEAIDGAQEYFAEKIEECGGNIVLGILQGILDAIVGIGKWIIDNVFTPFFEGFKSAFGIKSPAKEMEPIGEYIFSGILQGILSGIKGIGKWVKNNVLKPMKKALDKLFSGGLKGHDVLEVSVKLLKKGWTTISKFVGTVVTVAVSLAKKAWSTISGFVGTAVTVTISLAKKAWSSISGFVGTAVSVSISLVKKGWSKISSFVGAAVSVAVSLAKKGWSTISKYVGTAVTVATSLKKSGWSTISKYVGTAVTVATSLKKSGWSTISAYVGTAVTVSISLLKKGWSTISGYIGTAVSVGISLFKSKWLTLSGFVGNAVSVGISLFKSGWTSISSFVGNAVSVGISLFKDGWSSIKSFFGLSNGGIIGANGGVRAFSAGGIISRTKASWWDGVQKYASGTARAHGTAFIAGEAGPEIVGHVNGRTEVLNKSQIAAAIHAAVLSAMSDAANAFAHYFAGKLAECANGIISAIYMASDIRLPLPVSMQIDSIGAGRYAAMLSDLSALRGGGYTAPMMSSGTVMPYSVAAFNASLDKLADSIETSNDELGQVVVRAISSAAISIVTAIQHSERTGSAPDLSGITQRTIDDINRRTRMYSASPIV